jgi:hypothetical protein
VRLRTLDALNPGILVCSIVLCVCGIALMVGAAWYRLIRPADPSPAETPAQHALHEGVGRMAWPPAPLLALPRDTIIGPPEICTPIKGCRALEGPGESL